MVKLDTSKIDLGVMQSLLMKTKLYPYQQKIVDSRKIPQIALFMSMG